MMTNQKILMALLSPVNMVNVFGLSTATALKIITATSSILEALMPFLSFLIALSVLIYNIRNIQKLDKK
jgi:hypothetical protein